MPIYSHSKLATYENCPRQFKLRYLDRIELPEEAEGIEAFLGSRVHDVLEKLHKELILSKMNSLEDLLMYYNDEWDKQWHDNIVIVKKNFSKEHYRNAGTEAITTYYKRHQPFNQSRTIATEQLITFKINGHSIRGYIDRLSRRDDGTYEIHDYKTSGTLPAQSKFDADRQLALYQIGIREQFSDAKDVSLVWHYLIFDTEFRSERSESQLEDLKAQVEALINEIEQDTKFVPVESNLCGWCEYPEYCPAKKHELKVQSLPPNKYLKEEGVSLVNKYANMKARIKDLKEQQCALEGELGQISEAAAAYAKKEGITNIVGSDHMLKILEESVISFPGSGDEGREDLENIIKKAGLWESVSGLNLSRLNKAIDEQSIEPDVIRKIIELGVTTEKISVRLARNKVRSE